MGGKGPGRKKSKTSKYYGVSKTRVDFFISNLLNVEEGSYVFEACLYNSFTGTNITKCFQTEREAAIHVDKILINQGREPVNILKRVNKS